MNNIEFDIKGNKLIVTMDFSAAKVKSAPLSKQGKSKLVASTGGFTAVEGLPEGMSIAVNLITKA